jgi:predicted HTH domain antitoxin
MKRKIKVTITKIQRKIVSVETADFRGFCQICGETVETLSFNQAVENLQINEEKFDWLVKSEKMHLVFMADEDFRICQNSVWRNKSEMFLLMRH